MHCAWTHTAFFFSFLAVLYPFFKAKCFMLVGDLGRLCPYRSFIYAFYFIVKTSSKREVVNVWLDLGFLQHVAERTHCCKAVNQGRRTFWQNMCVVVIAVFTFRALDFGPLGRMSGDDPRVKGQSSRQIYRHCWTLERPRLPLSPSVTPLLCVIFHRICFFSKIFFIINHIKQRHFRAVHIFTNYTFP